MELDIFNIAAFQMLVCRLRTGKCERIHEIVLYLFFNVGSFSDRGRKFPMCNRLTCIIAAIPSDVARAASSEERLGRGADALRGREPGRGGRHAAAPGRRLHAAAAHRAAHAPRARPARPGAPQDEGEPATVTSNVCLSLRVVVVRRRNIATLHEKGKR